jgi:alanyl-tRNA synthetase
LMDIESARKAGAMALFGEKYDAEVRVLTMGEAGFSKELCGGTHVSRTGDIGLFRVISEAASSAGVRRIEAVTGERALAEMRRLSQLVSDSAAILRAPTDQLVTRIDQVVSRSRELEKEIERLKQKLASGTGNDLGSQVQEINGVKVLAAQLDGADSKSLRIAMDKLKDKLGSAVILLAAAEGDKISVVAGVTGDLTGRFNAGELVRHVSEQLGGKGGGRADMAQGGGTDLAALPRALADIPAWIAAR